MQMRAGPKSWTEHVFETMFSDLKHPVNSNERLTAITFRVTPLGRRTLFVAVPYEDELPVLTDFAMHKLADKAGNTVLRADLLEVREVSGFILG